MGERRGTKALELWCRRITDGYPGVNVQNMTTSWRDGLAFCAMIHHFRPDLVDFNSLNKDDVYGNNELAFRTAEEHLGIPALLDAEDMASCAVPDRLSILTYLSQFYQTFGGLSPSRTAMKRTSEESDSRLASVSGSPQPKVGVRLGVQRKEPCVVCGLPVFLAEKLVISRSLYHRTCFRCARCNNQLTLGNYYETEEGQYCCETCPDEENAAVSAPVMHQDYNQSAVIPGGGTPLEFHYRPPPSPTYKRALSDEEKSSKRAGSVPSSAASKVRLNFMTSHLLAGNENEERCVPPSPVVPDSSPHPADVGTTEKTISCTPRESSDDGEPRANAKTPLSVPSESRLISLGRFNRDKTDIANKLSEPVGEEKFQSVNSEDYSLLSSKYSVAANQRSTNYVADKSREVVIKSTEDHTKDSDTVNNVPEEGERLSLVQQRLKIFENSMNVQKEPTSPRKDVLVDATITKKKKKDREKEKEEENETIEKEIVIAVKEDSSNNLLEKPEDLDIQPPQSTPIEESSLAISQVDSHPPEPSKPEEEPVREIEKEGEREEEEKEELEKETNEVFAEVTTDLEEPRDCETSLTRTPGIDLSAGGSDYPEDLNPFQSDEEDEPKSKKTPSTNPFGSDDEDDVCEEIVAPPRPAARNNTSTGNRNDAQPPARRRLQAPQINLNPFWSDEEEEEGGGELSDGENEPGKPVPKPRTMKLTPEPSPVPRKTSLDRGGLYASNTSIASTGSFVTPGGTCRKKKPAPPPPLAQETFSPTSTFDTLVTRSQEDLQFSKIAPPRTPRTRKSKPAPPPPMSTSTPQSLTDEFPCEEKESAIWDDQKSSKDETNRNRQSLSGLSLDVDDSGHRFSGTFVDKSAQGKWKRKKGPAPPRPIPHKRKIKVMSVKDVKLELDQIELQQQGLEKQGVRLEQLIRDKSETGLENEEFMSLRVDVEELVLELFALVNEKNELFRRQAELTLLRRQQRLEEEHADVEYQIRCLMSQPEATKTDSDKQREEVLIQRLVEVVERRNEIVECLEMDRRREVEEDRSINEQMGLFAAKSKGDLTASNDNVHSSNVSKKEKLKEKLKEKKVKKSQKKDADKDVDETEMKLKRHKKKWF